MAHGWLTDTLILLPIGAAIALWILPWPRLATALIAVAVSLAEIGFWVYGLVQFDFSKATGSPQFDDTATWFGDLGISYHVGFIGIGLWLAGLTVVVQAAAIVYAVRVGRERPRAYFGLMLLLTGAIVGVFAAQDLLLFYVFWEAMLIPLYLLVGVWGGEGRQRATLVFFIYTMAGSLLMLASIIVFGVSKGTFDLTQLRTEGTSTWLFLGFVAAFAVKAPLFPFHGWLRDAYSQAPAEVAGVLSGVVSKAAAYGFLYIAIVLFPGPAADLRVPILAFAAIGLVYGSLLAFRAGDIRGVIAYSSLAQLGLIVLGVFATNVAGWNGALLQMVNHGLLSATLFMLAGIVELRTGTGSLDRLGGMARGRPALATVLMVTGVIALAVPGSTAFAGEFLILNGVFVSGWGWAVVGAIAIVLAAMYMLRLISAVLHERQGSAVTDEARDLRPVELALLVPLVACLLALSAWPAAITNHSFGQSDQTPGLGNILEPFEAIAAKIATPAVDWYALTPILALLGVTAACLLVAVLLPASWKRPVAAVVTGGGFVAAFVLSAFLFDDSETPAGIVAGAVVRDRLGYFTALVVCGAGLLATYVSWRNGMRRHAAEYYGLLAAVGAGMIFFLQANNLMTLFLGLEWFSISLYILCAIDVSVAGSLEAGLKYLIVGGFGSAVLLFGSALVYGATGVLDFAGIAQATAAQDLSHDLFLVTGLAMIIAGLAFKASAAPFHMWTPDVYEGAPTPVTSFMAAATKAAALVVTLRLLATAFGDEAQLWTIALAVIACVSLAVGNLAAIVQTNVKRLLAYSSIAQAGFMLIPIAAANTTGGKALLFYLVPYGAASLGAFAVVAARERELGQPVTLETIGGMGWERPMLGAAMWVFMLSFAGLPFTGGFVGKFYAFTAAYDRGWTWLVIVGVIATAFSLYYYLAVIRAMYMRAMPARTAPVGGQPPRELALSAAVGASLVIVVATFFAVEPLIDLCEKAVAAIPFPY